MEGPGWKSKMFIEYMGWSAKEVVNEPIEGRAIK